jgi:tetratricopeptide (TPR) repeat protein
LKKERDFWKQLCYLPVRSTDYDSKQGYGWTLLNLGGLYRNQGKLVQAEENLLEAIKMFEAISAHVCSENGQKWSKFGFRI